MALDWYEGNQKVQFRCIYLTIVTPMSKVRIVKNELGVWEGRKTVRTKGLGSHCHNGMNWGLTPCQFEPCQGTGYLNACGLYFLL